MNSIPESPFFESKPTPSEQPYDNSSMYVDEYKSNIIKNCMNCFFFLVLWEV